MPITQAAQFVWQIDDVFPPSLLASIHDLVEAAPLTYGWASNKKMGYSHWNHDFAHRGVDNGLDCSHEIPQELQAAWDFLQKEYFGSRTLLRCYTNAHTFGVEGYPHTDSTRDVDYTALIYLNHNWKREWGGETVVYADDRIVHAELPRYNHGLVFLGREWHCARSVSRICPDLRRTLMFKFAPIEVDPVRDLIQMFLENLGADKIKHSGRTLQKHLLNTYDYLKYVMNSDDVTAAAGGLHSIFGTNIFKNAMVPVEHRKAVAAVIGEAATELVELFRDTERPEALELALQQDVESYALKQRGGSTTPVSRLQLERLCAIEAANLHDQNSLLKWPNLTKFWQERKQK